MTRLADYDPQPPEWMRDALCAQVGDPELWFPKKGGSIAAAQQVCQACPVQAECLEHALETHQGFGIWGGVSPRARLGLLADDDWDIDADIDEYLPLVHHSAGDAA